MAGYNPYLNYNSPYMTQYVQANPQQMNQPLQKHEIIHVNGRNGADMFQMAPNSEALLLDDTASMVWFAQTDGAGYKTLVPFDIVPHKEAPQIDLSSLESRIAKLEERLNESNKSNNATNKQHQNSKKFNESGS